MKKFQINSKLLVPFYVLSFFIVAFTAYYLINKFSLSAIINIPDGVRAEDVSTKRDMSQSSADDKGVRSILLYANVSGQDVPVANLQVDMSNTRNWSGLSVKVDESDRTVVVHGLASAEGVAGSYNMLVPRQEGDTRVLVCPGATELSQVSSGCHGGYTMMAAELITKTIDGKDYWLVPGLTGTGAKSSPSLITNGLGTHESPYEISTCGQLHEIVDSLADEYILTANVDCTGTTWVPMGNNDDNPFSGVLNGNNKTISNIGNNGSIENNGLFGVIKGGTVKDLTVTGINLPREGWRYVGGLAGKANSDDTHTTTIDNVHVSGTIYGGYDAGGLIGAAFGSHVTINNSSAAVDVYGAEETGGLLGYSEAVITNSHATGKVDRISTDAYSYIGGLVGKSTNAISGSYATGAVIGINIVGGLIGGQGDGDLNSVDNCYATGNVTAGDATNSSGNVVGGLIGYSKGPVSNSHATGDVINLNPASNDGYGIGGLIGNAQNNTTIENCYATGKVDGHWSVGGLIGAAYNSPTVSKCYATGAVGSIMTDGTRVGGFIGTSVANISNSYAMGDVSGSSEVGGFAGGTGWGGVTITNSFSKGHITGSSTYGGLVGSSNGGSINSSYYDSETSGQSDTGKGTPRTTAQMKMYSTYSDWDFDTIWYLDSNGVINDGYPYNSSSGSALSNVATVTSSQYTVSAGGTSNETISGVPFSTAKDAFLANLEKSEYHETWNSTNISDPVVSGDTLVVTSQDTSVTVTYTITVSASSFSGSGSGTEASPFQITSCTQLQEMKDNLSSYYKLMNDIDCSDTINWNSGEGFKPVGTDAGSPFSGSFNGDIHIITGLTINIPSYSNGPVGIFGAIKGASIKNVSLENITINAAAATSVGSLVGTTYSDGYPCTIDSVNVESGTVTGLNNVGGLAGNVVGTLDLVQNSASAATVVSGSYNYNIGGLVGILDGNIQDCHATGSVSGGYQVGGLVGNFTAKTAVAVHISRSYATGNVSGDDNSAGFAGMIMASGTIGTSSQLVKDCYATGNVVENQNYRDGYSIAGFAGEFDSGTVQNSYSTGHVDSGNPAQTSGGFVGNNPNLGSGSAVTDSFWDTDSSGFTTSAGGTGKTDTEMKNSATYTNWDFNSVWQIDTNGVVNSGYPYNSDLSGGSSEVSSVATVLSSAYIVSAGGTSNETITNVPYGTAKDDLLSNLVKGNEAQTWNSSNINDTVVSGNTLIVTAEDGTTTVNYTISVNAELSHIATITSAVYTIDQNNHTITNIPSSTSKASFLANLTKGESNQSWTTDGLSDPVVPGNYMYVTAADGNTTITYHIIANPFSGNGSGSEADPYQITTCAQLQEMNNYLDANFILKNNIDCAETSSWNSGAGFIPVGRNDSNVFTGTFEGAWHTISNVTISTPNKSYPYVGIFGAMGGLVENVNLVNINVTTDSNDVYAVYGGTIAGAVGSYNAKKIGTIDNVHVLSGTVSGDGTLGGLVGWVVNYYPGAMTGSYDPVVEAADSFVKNSSSAANVTCSTNFPGCTTAGGLAGENWGQITQSYATGNVIGTSYSNGGLIGSNLGVVSKCYATGNVAGKDNSAFDNGGLVGSNTADWVENGYRGSLTDVYATGNVSGHYYTGGLVGNNNKALIKNAYATGVITTNCVDQPGSNFYCTNYLGKLVGNDLQTNNSENSFYNADTAGYNSGDGTALSTSSLKSAASFTNWDFDGVWTISSGVNNGYPTLRSSGGTTRACTIERDFTTAHLPPCGEDEAGYKDDQGIQMCAKIKSMTCSGGGSATQPVCSIERDFTTAHLPPCQEDEAGYMDENGIQKCAKITSMSCNKEPQNPGCTIERDFTTAHLPPCQEDEAGYMDENGIQMCAKITSMSCSGETDYMLILDSALQGYLADNPSVDVGVHGSTGTHDVSIEYKNDHRPLVKVAATFNATHDWQPMAYGQDVATGKSYVHSLLSLPGAGSNFTLYIPIPTGKLSSHVLICPGATSLADVTEGCSGEEIKTLADSGVSKVSTAAGNFWAVSGLTGTGGVSLVDAYEVSDTLSRLQADVASDHVINSGTINGITTPTDKMVLTFDPQWDLSKISYTDIDLLDDGTNLDLAATASTSIWGVSISTASHTITFTPPTNGVEYIAPDSAIQIKIGKNATYGTTGENQIVNPASVDTYKINMDIVLTGGSESAQVAIPIVDSDQVNITGFVNTFINFDIDTAVTDSDCAYNECLNHGSGTSAANYVVDLGELNSTWVNQSNSTAVMHSDNKSGVVNSIWFDLTSNAYSGVVVYVKSSNGGLQGPATNLIHSVSDGNSIQANDGAYGFQLTQAGTGNGTIVRNSNCTSLTAYCGLPITNKEVFNTNGMPLDGGRLRMDLAAAAAYTNNPGSYTDTLTFIAVPTF